MNGTKAVRIAGVVASMLGMCGLPALSDVVPPVPGDTCADPYLIPVIPYSVLGSTIGRMNDYDEACPYQGGGAPDVVYQYTPAYDEIVNITLCVGNTDYDSKLYVYEDSCEHGTAVACNDDACSSPVFENWVSRLLCVQMSVGHTYYIVVDGYGTATGVFQLDIFPPPPTVTCPPGAIQEPEPCGESTNAGCGADPPVFGMLPWDETFCGTLWVGAADWDTDWYEVELNEYAMVTWVVTAQIPARVMLIKPGPGPSPCDVITFLATTTGGGWCDPAILDSPCLAPGTYWLWIGTADFAVVPCPQEYTTTLTQTPCTPPVCPGDCDCDGEVGFGDIDYFVAAIPDDEANWAALYASRHSGTQPGCSFENCDIDGDGHVNFADIDVFVARIPATCPL